MAVFEPTAIPENVPLVKQLDSEFKTMNVAYLIGKIDGEDVMVRVSDSACTATILEKSPQAKDIRIETSKIAPNVVQMLLDDIEWRIKK